jgi:hypothetical protein
MRGKNLQSPDVLQGHVWIELLVCDSLPLHGMGSNLQREQGEH